MNVNPYVSFDGRCAEAFKFYEAILGGKIVFMTTWGEGPMKDNVPPETHTRVMHATLQLGDHVIMGADPPDEHYKKPQGMSISIDVEGKADAERMFNALAEGGNTQMPFQETFWSPGFGMCTDRFGIPWMVSCAHKPE